MHQKAGPPPATPPVPDAVVVPVEAAIATLRLPESGPDSGPNSGPNPGTDPRPVAPAGRVEVPPPSQAGEQIRIDVAPGMEIALSDKAYEPTQASYTVVGADLVVVLRNGGVVTLVDFFGVANPPAIIALLDSPPVEAPALLGQAMAAIDLAALEPAAGDVPQPRKPNGNASFTPAEADPMVGAEPSLEETSAPARVLAGPENASDFTPVVLPESDTSAAVTAPPEQPPVLPPAGSAVVEPPVAERPPSPSPPSPGAEKVPVLIVDRFEGATPVAAPELPALQPGQNLAGDSINGVDPRLLILDADREVIIRPEPPSNDAGAQHQAFGIVEIGFGGVFENVRVVPEGELGPDGEVSLGTLAAGTRFGLFTLSGLDEAGLAALQEGGTLALRGPEGQPASLDDGAPPVLVRLTADGAAHPVGGQLLLSLDGTPASPGDNPLNPDGLGHTVSGFDPATGERIVAFELETGPPGDASRDFADLLLRVRLGPSFQGEALHFPGGDGHLSVDLPPAAGDRLTGATVEIVSGLRPGDRLVMDGPADSDGDGLIDGTQIQLSWQDGVRFELTGEASGATYERVIQSIRFTSVATDIEPGTREVAVRLQAGDGQALEPLLTRFELRDETLFLDRHQHDFTAGDGNDVINALGGADMVRGGGGHDWLDGGDGDDWLDGGPGDDVLIGLTGRDVLTGGPGADRFVITSLGDGHDTITDFDWTAGDRLDLAGLFAGTGFDPAAPDVARWLRFELTEPTGDGSLEVQVIADLDGAGAAYPWQTIVTLLDPSRSDGLEIATATTFGRGSDGGTS